MVEKQRNLCRFPYLDNAIFQPSKMELVLNLPTLSMFSAFQHFILISNSNFSTSFLFYTMRQHDAYYSNFSTPSQQLIGMSHCWIICHNEKVSTQFVFALFHLSNAIKFQTIKDKLYYKYNCGYEPSVSNNHYKGSFVPDQFQVNTVLIIPFVFL